jgi:4-amino-4-deoxy-L-arabinose transferase-like glycosyltransferase
MSLSFWTIGRLAPALGGIAAFLVVATLGAPGITCDEPLDVGPGRKYVATLLRKGGHFFDREVVWRVYHDNAEHPPLGRWLLGLASTLGEPFESWLGGPDPFSVHAGRLAPALAFAVLVDLIARTAGRRYGRVAALVAGLSLILMPRVFAHAHFGALDTFLTLFWIAALLAAVRALERKHVLAAMAGAGVVWGLALLTKIHAWLLPPIVLIWSLTRLRLDDRGNVPLPSLLAGEGPSIARVGERLPPPSPLRGGGGKRSGLKAVLLTLAAFVVWLVSGLTVFFLGWPWLWYDTLARLRQYFGTGLERPAIRVQYFGQVYLDRDVPWHYPWFYFAVTVPVGLHLLGTLGVFQAWRMRRADSFPLLLVGTVLFWLAVFSTRVPVYDGERLFLVVFPLWALVIGLGFAAVWRRAQSRWLRGLLVALFAAQGHGVTALHPFGLSYYNALVGGLPGAERRGLELTYWGDAIDRVLLDGLAQRARAGQTVALVPTLHHVQPEAAMTPALFQSLGQRGDALRSEADAPRADWLIVYRRTAYWRPELGPLLARAQPLLQRTRQGVWLSRVYALPPSRPHAGDPRPDR